MRDYAKIAPTFWTGETGKKLRAAGGDAQRVALYLLSGPPSNWIGLFYLPLPTLYHEVGISPEGASEALRRVSKAGFGYYDPKSEHVWIPEAASWQIGESLKPNDKRVEGIIRELKAYRKSPFLKEFLKKYGVAFHIPLTEFAEEMDSPSEGASEDLGSQNQNQKQKQEQNQEGNVGGPPPPAPAAPTDPAEEAVFTFPCKGMGAKTWELTERKLAEYREAFPAIDVRQECRAALQWCFDNPSRQKTAAGMTAFLNRWLSKEQNRAASQSASSVPPPVQRLIKAFGIAQGHRDDPQWFPLWVNRLKGAGAELLAYFDGDLERAALCIDDVAAHWKGTEIEKKWGWNAVMRRASSFKRGEPWSRS